MKQVFRHHRLCEQDSPLGPYIEAYSAEMHRAGYARQTSEVQIRLVADFGHWLARHRMQAEGDYGRVVSAVPSRTSATAASHKKRFIRLAPIAGSVVRQGIVPAPVLPMATPAERLQSEFRLYLEQERALTAITQAHYLTFLSEFLKERFGAGPVDLSILCAADVIGFVRRRAATIKSKRVQLMTTALRSFLRFAHYRGDIHNDLAACVPAVANWKLSTIPRALPPAHVERVLDSIDRNTALGRRDYAILLTLARLGLRANEIRLLTLEDLDWQEGLITVRGKAGRYSQLPLPADVGAAIADYLRKGRPTAVSRSVFPPLESACGISPESVCHRLYGETHTGAGRH